MKKIISMLLTLLLVLAFCSCEFPWNKSGDTESTEESDTSAPTNETTETTEKPTKETVPSTLGTASELSDGDMPSMDWSDGENQ